MSPIMILLKMTTTLNIQVSSIRIILFLMSCFNIINWKMILIPVVFQINMTFRKLLIIYWIENVEKWASVSILIKKTINQLYKKGVNTIELFWNLIETTQFCLVIYEELILLITLYTGWTIIWDFPYRFCDFIQNSMYKDGHPL